MGYCFKASRAHVFQGSTPHRDIFPDSLTIQPGALLHCSVLHTCRTCAWTSLHSITLLVLPQGQLPASAFRGLGTTYPPECHQQSKTKNSPSSSPLPQALRTQLNLLSSLFSLLLLA